MEDSIPSNLNFLRKDDPIHLVDAFELTKIFIKNVDFSSYLNLKKMVAEL